MAYFSVYGPSYVEWLGDLSCNVHFQDRFSAARAIENLSQELPSPPPAAAGDTESAEVTPSSEQGRARIKLEEPDETQEAETKNDDGERPVVPPLPPDFGAMGWRLGKHPLRKVANDRHGRRGTTARLLMRVATSLDMLDKRPSSWPKPPPGFTTKRVLGPGSDFPRGRNSREEGTSEKRRRNDYRDDRTSSTQAWGPTSGGDHPLLSGGLRSGRGGFSLEEMEAERAKKRAKKEEE